MKTALWRVDAENPAADIIGSAARIITEGDLVAFPTETVYGLGANGLDANAVQKIFLAKGRPADNPLILHIASSAELFQLVRTVPPQALSLMKHFWPGPLTLVLPSSGLVPAEVTAGLATVAVRMPQHPVALALIKKAGVPIAAPSANRSGYPSPTTAQHVWDDLAGRISAILDGGPTGVGLESTVLDLTGEIPMILRPGGVTYEELAQLLGEVKADPGLTDALTKPKAPGMKYTHYSPQAQVILVKGTAESLTRQIAELCKDYHQQGLKVGLLLTKETWRMLGPISAAYQKNLGSRRQLQEIARVIYSELRACDIAGVDIILTETYQEKGLGAALMNRLLKAAGHKVIRA